MIERTRPSLFENEPEVASLEGEAFLAAPASPLIATLSRLVDSRSDGALNWVRRWIDEH